MRLEQEAERRGISLTAKQTETLNRFASIVLEKAVIWGISGRKTLDEILGKDILDSLLLIPYIKETGSALDIGSGAGFPGIPLKIVFPAISFRFLEAKKKATRFLEEAIAELCLPGAQVTWMRAEDAAKVAEFKGKFEVVFGRAVAPMEDFLAIAAPFVGSGGRIVFQKGKRWQEELSAAEQLIATLGFDIESRAPGLEGEQKIIALKKK